MLELKLLFLQMAVILFGVRCMAWLCRAAGQPAVVGEMAAGILLGPSFFGSLSPNLSHSLFPAGGLTPLYALSQLGLILFMFLVGLEVRPETVRGSAKAVLPVSVSSLAAPLVLGGTLAWAMYPRLGGSAPRLPFVLFVGAAIAVTAFPVLARILADQGLLDTRVGAISISCAAFDDVCAWFLLAVITLIARPGTSSQTVGWRFAGLIGYILAIVFVIRPALSHFSRRKTASDGGNLAAMLIFLLLSASATEALGVHALFGAFLAGVLAPRNGKLADGLRDRLGPVTLTLLLPLYFAYTGLHTSIGLLSGVELWALCGAILLVAVASKLAVNAVIVRLSGMTWRESLAVGVLLNARGLVELVIAGVGLELGILSPTVFSMLVVMAFATTLMTTPLLNHILRPHSASCAREEAAQAIL